VNDKELRKYLLSLKVGERVIETSRSCMYGATGTVYRSKGKHRGLCVKWDTDFDGGRMSTATTGGTRRISEVLSAALNPPTCGFCGHRPLAVRMAFLLHGLGR
jgi:hypothetical protein